MEELEYLTRTRSCRPWDVQALARRRERPAPWGGRPLLVIAADHVARGVLAIRDRPQAMGDRSDLLARLCSALARPGVDGVLGTPDIVEDLLMLGVLDGKVVLGSMNRSGLSGSAFEADDRFTAYQASSIAAMGLDGGKMLCRIDPEDPATPATLHACSQAIGELAERRLTALVEPLWARRVDGRLQIDTSTEAVVRAVGVAQALGPTSAYTWLKLPVVDDMEQVMRATTLPTLLLGGDPVGPAEDRYARWEKALRLPGVRGLVVGRSLLYPPGDDVEAAVDTAVALLPRGERV